MITNYQHNLKKQLDNTATISYKEICEILDAFQIASGQGFAIGKTKALLDFLKGGNSITIENFNYSNENKNVSSTKQLANIYKHIDLYIDLASDKDFKNYFSS